MAHTEETLERQVIYQGRIITVTQDTVRLENGKNAKREVVHHHGGAAIVPVGEHGEVYMVRQFRYPMGRELLEIPAGKMDRGPENAEEAGRRELSEETGLTAGQMISMGEIWPSPGFMDERLYLYCAKELAQGACHPDADEFVEIVRMPFEELCQRVASGEIHDAKTVAAVGKMLIMGL